MSGTTTLSLDDEVEATMPSGRDWGVNPAHDVDLEIYPATKKPHAAFPDRITIGRTTNNDIVIADSSVSRLHAYVRREGAGSWVVADAGSKNGSWLRGQHLEARKEKPLASRASMKFGEVELTFFLAEDLYTVLGGA